jgi:hypothetical protein
LRSDTAPDLFDWYWDSPEYVNAWRLSFENQAHRGQLLAAAVRRLPSGYGTVDFLQEPRDRRFVLLLTHDLEDVGARLNSVRIVRDLVETEALRFVGVEGSVGPFDTARYRDAGRVFGAAHSQTIEVLFNQFLLSPLEAVAVTSSRPVELWGIDDEALYLRAAEQHGARLSGGSGYWETIRRRAPKLFENFCAKAAELGHEVVGADLTQYNYLVGHDWLAERGIGHAGINAASSGDAQRGRIESAFEREPYDENEAALWRMILGWKRPRGWRPRGA